VEDMIPYFPVGADTLFNIKALLAKRERTTRARAHKDRDATFGNGTTLGLGSGVRLATRHPRRRNVLRA